MKDEDIKTGGNLIDLDPINDEMDNDLLIDLDGSNHNKGGT
jgi:hypothetical protein